MSMDVSRMKPQACAGPVPGPEARTRMAMQMGAAMNAAQVELQRPAVGTEAAELAGAAARAAVLGFIDQHHPETTGFPIGLVCAIAQQAYGAEWSRLVSVPREWWRA